MTWWTYILIAAGVIVVFNVLLVVLLSRLPSAEIDESDHRP